MSTLLLVIGPIVLIAVIVEVYLRWRNAGRRVDRLADPTPTPEEILREARARRVAAEDRERYLRTDGSGADPTNPRE